ncbi:type ISP restriction/modification enzyme [Deinococcus sp. UR1]|uniref:type ISP restriction/modification enzyme n=2 Tax=unclassified Deinococcus TaxID=2623546 RepID=UPI000C19E091|nr:type ISP restriction/modification enzyme [Deinococcus sp. UR1]PIG99739.1 hypothetical protein AMD26_002245 [Deinococcus sp. UR1]
MYVLDPATGTGSYLTATLDRIWRTLKAQPDFDDATLDDLRAAVKERLIGFEIMPAPYVIAHLRLSQQLARYGVTLRPSDPAHPAKPERAAVYLTNALTNWHTIPEPLSMPELQAEQDAAQHVKKSAPILVILGNPPYSAFAGTSQTEEGDLIADYKQGLVTEWGIRKFNLDDLYVRFYRIAERKVAQGGRGIVSFISPSSCLNDPSFVVMRRKLLTEFDHLTFDNLNGDSRETGKRTPDGQPDPSIFSTPSNRAGIRSGTAVSLLVRTGQGGDPTVQYREFWGAGKGTQLLDALHGTGPAYQPAAPTPANRHTFRPETSSADYQSWPKVVELAERDFFQGMDEDRGGALYDMQPQDLEIRMKSFFDTSLSFSAFEAIGGGLARNSAGYVAESVRLSAQKEEGYDERKILRYVLRPFDVRSAYVTTIPQVWKRARPDYQEQYFAGGFFITRSAAAASEEGVPFYFTSDRIARDALRGHAVAIPLILESKSASDGLFASSEPTLRANLSPQARAYLASLGAPDPDASPAGAALLWHHALAVGFSGAYLSEHAGGIAGDWPRIPLPGSLSALTESAALGARVAALLDDPQVPTRPELGAVGRLKRVGEDVHGFEVRAGWGALQRGNVVMPGRGRTTERAADGLPPELGERVLDVALNDAWVWENVPALVWEYTIGGYQVMKKWLSYREFGVLGRALTLDEAREVSRMARRLAELVLLGPQLDASYARVQGDVWAWGAGG